MFSHHLKWFSLENTLCLYTTKHFKYIFTLELQLEKGHRKRMFLKDKHTHQ